MRTGLAVADVMTRKPVSIPPNVNIQTAAKIMKDKDVGSLLVIKEEELMGIITQVDMIEKVVATAKNPEKIVVEEVMTKKLWTITPEKDIYEALTTLRDHNIRHLPVLHNKQLVGFLTMKDILRVEPQLFEMIFDSIELREEERKLELRTGGLTQIGYCEVCGNYSERLRSNAERMLACPDCHE